MAVRRVSAELIAQRFVHLHIVPRPSSLSESREIYRVLQRFGDISKYYSLQFEYHSPAPSSALVIYRNQSSAQEALDASPIRFALERTQHTPHAAGEDEEEVAFEPDDDTSSQAPKPQIPQPTDAGIDDILRPSTLLTRTAPTPTNPHSAPSPPLPFAPPSNAKQKTVSRWFQVTVDRSRVVHQDYVERQPFWKQFDPMKSIGQQDLEKKVPHSGLSDVSKRPPHAYRTPNHVLRMMNEHLMKGEESLVKMWKEGEQRGEEEGVKEEKKEKKRKKT